jgi:hypothetical protein
MSDHLFEAAKRNIPNINKRFIEGVPVQELAHAKEHIDRYFKIASQNFPPGVEYLRVERCTPQEAHEALTGKKRGSQKPTANRPNYDLARTDMFMLKVFLRFNGEDIPPKFLGVPFAEQAGTIHLRGPLNTISPVLADPILSVSKDSIFIPFLRDRVTFYRHTYYYRKNGLTVNKYIVWSPIHSYAPKATATNSIKTTVPHYLFCKLGLHEAFRLYAGAEIAVGYDEINTDTYPASQGWDIYESNGQPLKRRSVATAKSLVRLAMRSEVSNNLTQSMLAAFFYLVDAFPERVLPKYCHDPALWKVLMGLLLEYSDRNEGRLISDIETHLASLDQYVDTIVKDDLSKVNIFVNDIYELFVYMTKNISAHLIGATPNDLFEKKLMVNRYVLLDYIKAIFNFSYKLNSGSGKRDLSLKVINQAAGKFLNPNIIYNLPKSHGEVNIVSSPGDCYLFKHTCRYILQVDATSRRGSGKRRAEDSSRSLHVSLAYVASARNLPKPEPTGQTQANPWVEFTHDLHIRANPKTLALRTATQKLIAR